MPDALEEAGFRVQRHSAHFAPNARDTEFIPAIGDHPDWIYLTKDGRQRYNADERDAIMRSGVAQFIHVGAVPHDELATSLVLAAPRIIRFREKHAPPFIAKVYRPEKRSAYRVVPGAIRMALTYAEWERTQRRK